MIIQQNIKPENIVMLLKSIGAPSNLLGFKYAVFIVHQAINNPQEPIRITKTAYPMAAKHYGVTPASVEHAIRTLIASCWDRYDHSEIDRVAGVQLEKIPTNTEFISMLVDHLLCSTENYTL